VDHQQLKVGSVADLDILPSIFHPEDSPQAETVESDEDEDGWEEIPPASQAPAEAMMAHCQERALQAVKQDCCRCNEWAPAHDPNKIALAAIDSSLSEVNARTDIDKYLPEPQSAFKAVLNLDCDI
jgi:hypothetical protein